ncbi:MAG: hypothetical protein WDN44_02790 [Sphingomonas sp.]
MEPSVSAASVRRRVRMISATPPSASNIRPPADQRRDQRDGGEPDRLGRGRRELARVDHQRAQVRRQHRRQRQLALEHQPVKRIDIDAGPFEQRAGNHQRHVAKIVRMRLARPRRIEQADVAYPNPEVAPVSRPTLRRTRAPGRISIASRCGSIPRGSTLRRGSRPSPACPPKNLRGDRQALAAVVHHQAVARPDPAGFPRELILGRGARIVFNHHPSF